jgi:hypothetical protein
MRKLPLAEAGRFRGNPYFLFGRRPFRERRIRSYVHAQHRAGRPLAQILGDPKLDALGGRSLLWTVLTDPATIRALGDDVRDELAAGLGRRAGPR